MDRLEDGDPAQIGPFRLLGRLGEGGMGRVYLGTSRGGRKVAIKVVHAQFARDPEFRRRFAREVAAARRVGGFHTALVVDADPDADSPWMATSYVPGPSLADAVTRHGPLDEAGVRQLGAALAEGLAAIHASGLIHRDLKPGNIIMASDGPRIIDFGIAKSDDITAITESRAVIGTLRYMSPEQLDGREITSKSDIFALGTVLAYAGRGRDPFEASAISTVIYRIVHDAPSLDPLTGDLRDIISACLAKDPGDRPAADGLLARFSPDEGAGNQAAPVPPPVEPAPPPLAVPPATPPAAPTLDVPPAPSPGPQRPAVNGPPPATTTGVGYEAPPAPAIRKAHRRRSRSAAIAVAAAVAIGLTVGLSVLLLPGDNPTASVPSAARHSPPATSHPRGSGKVAAKQPRNPRTATGSFASALRSPGGGTAFAMTFSPTAKILAVGSENVIGPGDAGTPDVQTSLWNTSTGKIVGTLIDPNTTGITAVAFDRNGATLAVGDNNGTVYLWNTASRKMTVRLAAPTTYSTSVNLTAVAFSPNGTTLAAGDLDGNVYLWNVTTKEITAILNGGSYADPRVAYDMVALAFSPDGATLAIDEGAGVYLWNTATGKITASLTPPGSPGDSFAMALAPDGATVADGRFDGNTYLWNITYHGS